MTIMPAAQFSPSLPTLPHWLALAMLLALSTWQAFYFREQIALFRKDIEKLEEAFLELSKQFHDLDKRVFGLTKSLNGGK